MKHIFSSDLFAELMAELEKRQIRFFILRNFEGLPDINPSKDVDILIRPNDLKKSVNCLKEKAVQLGYKLVWKNSLDYLYGFVFMKIEDGAIFSMKVDLFRSFSWRGMNYIDDTKLFDKSIKYNGFYILQPSDEAITMIFYYVLYAKKIREKYFENIVNKALSNEGRFRELLMDHLSSEIAEKIVLCVREGRVQDIVSFRSSMVKGVIQQNMRIGTCFNLLEHVCSELYNFRNPWRKLINRFIERKYATTYGDIWKALAQVGITRGEYSKLTSDFFRLIKRMNEKDI